MSRHTIIKTAAIIAGLIAWALVAALLYGLHNSPFLY